MAGSLRPLFKAKAVAALSSTSQRAGHSKRDQVPRNMDKQMHSCYHGQVEVAIAKSYGHPKLSLEKLGLGAVRNAQGAQRARNIEQMKLPKYLVFKGDNGKYLSVLVYEGHNHLNFYSSDIGDSAVLNIIDQKSDGTVSIKSRYFGKYWKRSPTNWIWAEADDSNSCEACFKMIHIDSNCYVLRSMSNYCFCMRAGCGCLAVAAATIRAETKLWLEEPVLSRKIYGVSFQLSQARIYTKEPLTMSSACAVNNTSATNKYKLDLSFTETTKKHWDNNVTLKLGVETKIQSGVSWIVNGEVTVKGEISGSYTWGTSLEEQIKHTAIYEADVPPRTKVTVTAIMTRGSFEVPFSYKQADLMTTGCEEIKELNDGIYGGVNCYNLKYESVEEKI